MPAIEIRGLTKGYGDVTVLREIDLPFTGGDHWALLGPSGAGKSTLLRILAGLETPDAGQIELDGIDITRVTPDQRGLALMSQDYALYPQLNVQKNLETALLSLRLSRAESDARCAAALEWFRIASLSGHLPSQLSGGQAQRVALAKALIRRPSWLLLDEPFSQLDGPLREELRELLAKVSEHFQTSLIFVTHDPLDALRLATQVAILDAGRIQQVATPARAYQHPTCRAAAELLSPWGVNWLSPQSLNQCAVTPLVQELATAIAAGEQVGFRPEAAQIEVSNLASENGLRMPVMIQRVVHVGFAQLHHCSAAGQVYRCLSPDRKASGQHANLFIPTDALLRI